VLVALAASPVQGKQPAAAGNQYAFCAQIE